MNAPRLTYRTKLLVTYVGLVTAILVVTTFALDRSLSADLATRLFERLEHQTRGAALWSGSGRHPENMASRLAGAVSARVTVIDRDGAVLGDSDFPGRFLPPLGSQAQEPEVKAAHARGMGRAIRRLDGRTMVFTAAQTETGDVVRLGVPLAEIDAPVATLRMRLLVTGAIALLVAIMVGLLATRFIARPLRVLSRAAGQIAKGEYKDVVRWESEDEFGLLSRTLSSMATELEERITRMRKLETMRRDFVANVSHELRTPVAAIQGYAETLLGGERDAPTTREFLEVILRHSRRMTRLVEDLLRLSELEVRGSEAARHQPVHIADVTKEVERTLRARLDERNVHLVLDVPDGLFAEGDPDGLEQVLENLVDNAIKYGRDGGRIGVTATRSGGVATIEVDDDGPGIPPDRLSRIFERFYQAHSQGGGDRRGSGLGLAIVKHLCEAMGGRISAASEVGRGTQFRVVLPAAESIDL